MKRMILVTATTAAFSTLTLVASGEMVTKSLNDAFYYLNVDGVQRLGIVIEVIHEGKTEQRFATCNQRIYPFDPSALVATPRRCIDEDPKGPFQYTFGTVTNIDAAKGQVDVMFDSGETTTWDVINKNEVGDLKEGVGVFIARDDLSDHKANFYEIVNRQDVKS